MFVLEIMQNSDLFTIPNTWIHRNLSGLNLDFQDFPQTINKVVCMFMTRHEWNTDGSETKKRLVSDINCRSFSTHSMWISMYEIPENIGDSHKVIYAHTDSANPLLSITVVTVVNYST